MCAEYKKMLLPSKVSNEDISANKMISALSSIALEMQKFHKSAPISCHNFGENQEICDKLNLCKSNLRLKRKQIKLLKENLRKACIVAKTVMSAKENETMSLHNHINSARSEYADLSQKNKTNVETIRNLLAENKALKEKMEHLENFIELGYQELQKIQDIPAKDMPVVMQLKEIMLSCGQYYADYSNEHVNRTQLEQKNRFLNNKLNIISNNLQAVIEELKNLRYQNVKLQKENSLLKNKYFKQIDSYAGIVVPSRHTFREENTLHIQNINYNTSVQSVENDHSFDLTSHLSLVKSLLNNQDSMLKDLRKLSEKLSINSNFGETTILD
ncbi:kinesin-related protein 12-like [Ostrinia nubilalis]|uniref:kinesin-related protein 12-like n=1 Tax=Ostrinia nubilalis TaxID=29057 RepID=UPI0030824439